jgi:hypothetical protein
MHVDSLDTSAEDRLGYSSKAPLGTSRLSVPLHKDAKTSEGLLYIRLTFSLQAAYFSVQECPQAICGQP